MNGLLTDLVRHGRDTRLVDITAAIPLMVMDDRIMLKMRKSVCF